MSLEGETFVGERLADSGFFNPQVEVLSGMKLKY